MRDRVRDNSDRGLSAVEERAVMVLGGSEEAWENGGCGIESIDFEVDILGDAVDCRISVGRGEARLSDIVPLARLLSTEFALAMLERLGRSDEIVPCRKGCSACCSYLIPLSIPEVFRFREEVLTMPAELGGAVLRQCLETAERILSAGPAECFGNEPGGVETGEVGKWYRGLEMTCPLLSDGLCTRYEQRPTVCREHIVMGSSLACRVAGTEESLGDGSHIAIMPVSVVQALGQLTAELEGTDVEAVMLPLALPWAEGNLERGRRTWPAKVIVERFVEILREMGS